MKAELITGSLRAPVHEYVAEQIKREAESGGFCYLIVPEQQTLAAEKEMSRELPDSAPLYFEVTNFTRLADSVFRRLGGIAGERPDRARRALVMWQCLTELAPSLKTFGARGAVSAGQVTRAIAACGELDAFGIDAAALAEAGAACAERDKRLASKLADLALIASAYKKALDEKYEGSRDEIEALCDRLERAPSFLGGARIFIEGFTSFTEAQYRLIGILMKRCELSIALPLPRGTEEGFEYTEMRHARSRLMKLAARQGVTLAAVRLAATDDEKAPLLAELCDGLWRSNAHLDEETETESDALRIFEARDPYEECEFVAADIRRRVAEGARYGEMAIVARDAERYVGILDSALNKNEVPHFLSKHRDVLGFEATRFMCSALTAVSSDFAREDVITYAKSGFAGISRDACDEFELYAEQWQITGRRFRDEGWAMRPEGYTVRREDGADEKLARINETRNAIMEPLLALEEALTEAKTVREHAAALVAFLARADVEGQIAMRSDELARRGETDAAEENAALWGKLCEALDTLVEAAGDSPAETDGFKNRLELVLAEVKLGRIPSHLDEVTVGSADMLRLGGKRHVYLIGANEGEFPAVPKEQSFFSDREKAVLPQYSIEIEKNSEFDYARELFYFSRAFAAGKESVTVLFADSGSDFKAARPSEAVNRLTAMSGGRLKAKKIGDLPLGDRLYSASAALSALSRGGSERLGAMLAELGYEARIEETNRSIVNAGARLAAEAAQSAFPNDVALTQTRIDKYVDCPFSYFCKYVLRLSSNEQARFDARNVGSYIHAILENYFAELSREGKSAAELGSEERREIAERAARAYIGSLGDGTLRRGRFEFMTERLKNAALPVIDGLCDELSDSTYAPRFFELAIAEGKADAPEALKFELADGRCARVFGSVDRVDTFKAGNDVYVRVIDYKTGAKTFSPGDLAEGRNLQMFLYLKSIVDTTNEEFLARVGAEEGGRLIPGGVIYVNTDIGDVKVPHADEALALAAIKKNQKRDGMLLDAPESIGAMSCDSMASLMKKKDRFYTAEGWDELGETVKASVARVGNAIVGGHFEATPKADAQHSPCTYCEYKPICRSGLLKSSAPKRR